MILLCFIYLTTIKERSTINLYFFTLILLLFNLNYLINKPHGSLKDNLDLQWA